MNAYKIMQKQKILTTLFYLGVMNARLNARVVDFVRACLTDQDYSSQ